MKVEITEIEDGCVTFEGAGISGQARWCGQAAPHLGKRYDVEFSFPQVFTWGETAGIGDAPSGAPICEARVEGDKEEGVVPLRIGSAICLAEIEGRDAFSLGERIWLVPVVIELYPISY
jgi:hypothetical protein